MKCKLTEYDFPTLTQMLDEATRGRDHLLLFQEERKGGRQVTYGQWRQELLETAGRFQQLDAKHIGVVCDLSYDCILCMYAVIVSGKVLVPLEGDLTGTALDACVEKADIDLVLYHDGRIDGVVTRCAVLLIPEFLKLPFTPMARWPVWDGSRDACIFFTSGTEGEPCAVLLTQKNLSFMVSYSGYKNYKGNPRILLFLPIHHVFSFSVLSVCIHDGCEVYLSESIKYVSREIQNIKPHVLTTVPLVNELFRSRIQKGIASSGRSKQIYDLVRLSNALRRLGIDLRGPMFCKLRASFGGIPQLLITGGSAVSQESVAFFDDFGILLVQGYGLTETSLSVSANTLESNRPGSVGKPFGFNQVRIKDGEIQVRGENVMKGYYKDPAATQRAFDEGWLRTGDLGYLDQDGYLFITGRKKNLIILDSGENVSPEELEKQLLRCPWIREVVVSHRDHHIHAQIVGKPDGDETAMKAEIRQAIDALNRNNPVYKRIASWELRKEPFEKTSSLKIRRE